MQLAKILLLAAAASAAGTATEAYAQRWLRTHQGNPDELSDLKNENPDAYALVNALLTKRSLGLLNARHPTASFAAPAQEPEQLHGAEAYAQFQSTPHASGGSHDWMSWKPKDSASDDEAMVNNVLGAVANLKGISMKNPAAQSENPLENEEASFGVGADAAAAPAPHKVSGTASLEEEAREVFSSSAWHDGSAKPASPQPAAPVASARRASLAAAEEEESRQRASLAWTGGAVSKTSLRSEPAAQDAHEPAPSSNQLANDAADITTAAVMSTPTIDAVSHAGPSAEEQRERSMSTWKGNTESSSVASVAALSTPLHMHHHMSWSDWNQEKPAVADYKPKPVALNANSAAVNYKHEAPRSATDGMVNKMLDMVANMATGKNREILLRRKAHIDGAVVDSNPLVDAADTLDVQPMSGSASAPMQAAASSSVSGEEARERTVQAWKDQGSWAPPLASAIPAARPHVSASWAASVMPSTGAAEASVAETSSSSGHSDSSSLWGSIGRTAKLFGMKVEEKPATEAAPEPEQPARPSQHSLMAEFLKHSRNAMRHEHVVEQRKSVSARDSLAKDASLFSSDDSEQENAHQVQESKYQAVRRKASWASEDSDEARLAARAADFEKAKPETRLAATQASSPLDSFSFADPTSAPKPQRFHGIASSGSETALSPKLASWLGFASKVTVTPTPEKKGDWLTDLGLQ